MSPSSTSRIHSALSITVIVIGGLLMAGKIYADSEPGAIPLLMVGMGIAWYLLARLSTRSRQP